MANNNPLLGLAALAGLALLPHGVSAATVSITGGALTMNLDRAALASLNFGTFYPGLYDGNSTPAPGLYLEEFFDQATSASLPANQLGTYNAVPGRGEIPATNLPFLFNGASVTNLTGHHDQPTNFSFDTGNIAGTASGAIGMGGILRFRGNFGSGYLASGELSLTYDASRALDGASGWVLINHVSPAMAAYDLLNVQTSMNGNLLTLSGDMRFSPEVANAFFAAEDASKILGSVSLQATTTAPVPLPAAFWLFGGALSGLGMIGRRRRSGA